jgi:hypothetical protein
MPDPNQELELQRHMPCSYYVLSELVAKCIVTIKVFVEADLK